ncbi:MAG: tetratricopeptide repeat protein [Candidatus Thorarchaeota archaeon]
MTTISTYQLERNLGYLIRDYDNLMKNLEMSFQDRTLTEDIFQSLKKMDFKVAERRCLEVPDMESRPVPLVLLGLTYYLMLNIPASAEVTDKVLMINSDFVPALNLAGDICYVTGRIREAELILIKSINLHESQRHPRLILAQLYRTTGNKHEALSILEELCRNMPEDAVAWSALCEIHDEMGTIQKAEDLLKAEIQREENNFGAWHNIGVIYYNQGKLAEAERALLKAYELYSGDTNTLYTLGNLYKLSGRLPEAIDAFKKVLETDPDDSRALFKLSGALYFQGKQDDARTIFKKAVEIDPSLRERSLVLGI